MLIHSKMESTVTNGPGERAMIHLQGCSLGCPGCWNPDTHAFDNSKEVDMWKIYEWVLSLPDIEGVTFSGGEPMQQAPSIWLLMERLHQVRPQLSFAMYTGYTVVELETGHWKWKSGYDAGWVKGNADLWQRVRSHLDFAIMGRYKQMVQTTDKPLCGSLNQEVVFFTDRYSLKDIPEQSLEIVVDPATGLIQLTGFPVGVPLDDPLLRNDAVSQPGSEEDGPDELVSA